MKQPTGRRTRRGKYILQAAIYLLLALFLLVGLGTQSGWFSLHRISPDTLTTPVPSLPAQTNPAPSAAAALTAPTPRPSPTPLNINLADENDLTALPGIGTVLARRIIEYRTLHGQFTDPAQLVEITGISENTLAKFEHLIVAQPVLPILIACRQAAAQPAAAPTPHLPPVLSAIYRMPQTTARAADGEKGSLLSRLGSTDK